MGQSAGIKLPTFRKPNVMGNGGTTELRQTDSKLNQRDNELWADKRQILNNKMEITYRTDVTPDTEQIIDVYNSSGINRPTVDKERITKMYSNSNLIVTAWDNDKLVGISRSLTDFCYCCYLSDLAVRKDYQASGIGKKLIELTKNEIGEQTALLLLSAPTAMDYYPKVGFQKIDHAFLIKRTK